MGLFSSVIHLRDVNAAKLSRALDELLAEAGFRLRARRKVPAKGPGGLAEYRKAAGPLYFVGAEVPWTPVIQGTIGAEDDALWIGRVALQLSRQLRCLAVCLVLHDDDVLFVDLNRDGEQLDGYNSNPQYFEERRLSKKSVKEQRHSLEPFRELLTEARFRKLESVLARGWWSAHDRGALDADGLLQDDEDWVDEAERMKEVGTVLGLAGRRTYPFVDWAENRRIEWPGFTARSYCKS